MLSHLKKLQMKKKRKMRYKTWDFSGIYLVRKKMMKLLLANLGATIKQAVMPSKDGLPTF